VRHFLTASAAGATATLCTYPLDVLRTRLAACPQHVAHSQVFRKLLLMEGVAAAFSGIRPALIGVVPYTGISFSAFEALKAYLCRVWKLESDSQLKTWQRLGAGGLAGVLAMTATYPLNVVRRRMQMGSEGSALPAASSVWRALCALYVHEGVQNGLFKGLRLSLIIGPVQSAVGFAMNDVVREHLGKQHKQCRA